MASPAATVALATLTSQPDFSSSTITVFLQISFQAGGYYETGGVPSGIAALVSELGININQFLQADINSETAQGATQYTYKYVPATDSLQIYQSGVTSGELGSSAGIPSAVLNDTIVGAFRYNRL